MLFNDAWSQKDIRRQTRQLYSHQAVKEGGVLKRGGGRGNVRAIHIQRVYIGGPAFSINSQNADVRPEAHAPKCAINGIHKALWIIRTKFSIHFS